jgi:archaemetzincin
MREYSLAALTLALTTLVGHSVGAAEKPDAARERQLQALIAKLKPLHTPLAKPRPGEWLDKHKEAGQTFAQYLQSRPVTPTGRRNTIYVQPLGEFDETQREIVKLTADFLGRYFQRPVKVQKDLPLSVIPDEARRRHPTWGMDQILSTYVLDKVLAPRLPDDAAAYIAFTASDLWPGEGWNFVFGQASLSQRVGVWSIYRNGEPEKGSDEFRLCLLRTLKTATHETGHMFSLAHCTKYECDMCGSNHREESDRRPLEVCPECLAKICWATGCDPLVRFEACAEFCREHKLADEDEFYRRSMEAISK